MARRTSEDLLDPKRIYYRLIRDYIDGKLNTATHYFRARVEAVDVVGGQLESSPPNPPGSVRARVYTSGLDANLPSSALTIFYPLHPEGSIPVIQPGEHVFVIFEDENKTNGMWVGKIPNYQDINYSNPDQLPIQTQSTSADAFEGTSNANQSRQVDVLATYGGASTQSTSPQTDRAISTIEQSNIFQGKKILHIGDSHVKGFYGTELGRLFREKGASSYVADGRVSWGVVRWNDTSRYGLKSLTTLIQENTPDIIIISLGSNDFPRANFDRLASALFNQATTTKKIWVGPPTMVLGAASINQRVSRVADLLKALFQDLFIDTRNMTGGFGRTPDGVHFQQDGARSLANQVMTVLETKLQ